MKKNAVLGVGEVLIRLSAPNLQQFKQINSFDIYYGGGEFNVIASLANFGIPTAMLTKLSSNDIGEAILQYINSFGIDTSRVISSDDRMGIYFTEQGFSQRPSKVIYDRNNSAFSKIDINEFDASKIFDGIEWIHISGITPAINNNTYEFTKKIIKLAKENKVKISFDINWRNSLWDLNLAVERFSALIDGVDLCNGISPIKLNYDSNDLKLLKRDSYEYYLEICKQMSQRYKVKHIAFTNRDSFSMNENNVKCFYFNSAEQKLYQTQQTRVDIVDRIGTGDAFTAGILYGIITNKSSQEIVEFADSCFVLKHTIKGDINILNLKDVESYNYNKSKPIRIIR